MHEITFPGAISLEEYLKKLKNKAEKEEKYIDQNCDECYDTKRIEI